MFLTLLFFFLGEKKIASFGHWYPFPQHFTCYFQCLISMPCLEQGEAFAENGTRAGADMKLGLFSHSRSREGSREQSRDGAVSGTV